MLWLGAAAGLAGESANHGAWRCGELGRTTRSERRRIDGHDVISGGLHPGAPEPGPHDHRGADVNRRVRRLHQPVPHPRRPPRSLTAIQLFSFADYQTNFGGFFSSPWQPDYVGQAVFQFFLNGGSDATSWGSRRAILRPERVPPQQHTGSARRRRVHRGGADGASPSRLTAGRRVGRGSRPARWAPDAGGDLATFRVRPPGHRRHGRRHDLLRHDGRDVPHGSRSRTRRDALRSSNLVTVTLVDPDRRRRTPPTGSDLARGTTLAYRHTRHRRDLTIIDPGDFGAGVRGERAARQGADLQPDGDARDHRLRPSLAEALAYCERKRAFYIMDPPQRGRRQPRGELPGAFEPGADCRHLERRCRQQPGHAGAVNEPERRDLLPVPADHRPGHRRAARSPRRAASSRASSPRRTPTAASGSRRPGSRR